MAIDVGRLDGRVALNPPNVLSYLRVGCGVLAFVLVGHRVAFVACVLVGIATDWLDGFLARRTGARSRLGGLVDPICDKLFVLLILLALLLRADDPVPSWEVALVLGRDALSALMPLWALLDPGAPRIDFRAHGLGKLVTVLQYAYLAVRIVGLPGGPALAIAVAALTPPSLWLYALRYRAERARQSGSLRSGDQ
jgi:phosphatidylglycerophosphate synthase